MCEISQREAVSAQGVVMTMSPKKGLKKKTSNNKRGWVSKVKTVSTYPPEGLFTKDPETIARQLASKKGIAEGAGIRHEDADLLC